MPHIHTEPGQHDHTVSAYIIRYDGDTPLLLLHRHKKYGKILQIGGHVELNEDPWQSALHELTEETGYEPEQLQVLQPSAIQPVIDDSMVRVWPAAFLQNTFTVLDGTIEDHYHDDNAYVFVAKELPKALPSEGESSELVWLDMTEIGQWSDDVFNDVKQIAAHIFSNCLPVWQPIPLDRFHT